MFDASTGFYMRSGIIRAGVDSGVDPFMSSFPELIDIGIMGTCNHGKRGFCMQSGVQCYQQGTRVSYPNMHLHDFERIIDEARGQVYQVALGGRGDPNDHESFEDMLRYCCYNEIVPNYTTSGYLLTEKQAKASSEYCGAVAVSWYNSPHTLSAIDLLLGYGVKTNVHFVLSNSSIDHAIEVMSKGLQSLFGSSNPSSSRSALNAIVFLLHKPIGLGSYENVLRVSDPRVRHFFELVSDGMLNENKNATKIGFDSCSVPALINYSKDIDAVSFDTCEAARWSMYISADMRAKPCSFDMSQGFDLNNGTISDAWHSERFAEFRAILSSACISCKDRSICLGGCPIEPQIVLCQDKHLSDQVLDNNGVMVTPLQVEKQP